MDQSFLNLIVPNQAQDHRGIYSICSSHPEVLTAAICKAVEDQSSLLVEATPNQVNQYGGYSGLTPMDFRRQVEALALKNGLPAERITFGADHLGPYVWRHEHADKAMSKAFELTRTFVAAGFRKLHIDAGMPLGGDPPSQLDHAVIAKRTIDMIRTAEAAKKEKLGSLNQSPVYVIGAEAPVPGGGVEKDRDTVITAPEEISQFLEFCRHELALQGLADLRRRLIAVVVQPGVDFGDSRVVSYNAFRASRLLDFVRRLPEWMTCEVHATDYQSPQALAELVRDGFQILKVGPCLTYAYRQAVFALAEIEEELLARRRSIKISGIIDIIDDVMVAQPQHWQSHYRGTADQIKWLRRHSLRDRIRYYWEAPRVKKALHRLMTNLPPSIPFDLVDRFWPDAVKPQKGNSPCSLIRAHIQKQLSPYGAACKGLPVRPPIGIDRR